MSKGSLITELIQSQQLVSTLTSNGDLSPVNLGPPHSPAVGPTSNLSTEPRVILLGGNPYKP